MIAFATHRFDALRVAGDGNSVSDHMAVVRRRKGAAVAEGPKCPEEAGYLWLVWNELHAARTSGMVPNPISWTEIEAYQRVTGEPLLAWEARAVRAVDDAYIAAVSSDTGGTA